MNRNRTRRVAAVLSILAIALASLAGLGQETTGGTQGAPPEGGRPEQVSLFGGSTYEGGHLKYSYKVSREGLDSVSTTTTEITPQADGTYRVENSSSDVVSQQAVNISFFGIGLRGLGFRIPTETGGTVDLSPLSSIEDEVLEANRDYVLPDGGYLVAEEADTIAGIDVVYATYTHADFANVEVHLAFPVDLTIRNLLPLFPYLELSYGSSEGTAETDEGAPPMRSFSRIELTEFIYEPEGE